MINPCAEFAERGLTDNMSGKYIYTSKFKNIVIWTITVVVSVLFITIGHNHVSKDLDILNLQQDTVKAKVIELTDYIADSYEAGVVYENYTQLFKAEIISGSQKGEIVVAEQTTDNFTNMNETPVKVGDTVILYHMFDSGEASDWVFGSYARFDYMAVFGVIFLALLIIFGRMKGVNTIISLGFTCLAVFAVFVPSVLAGFNIYVMTGITCVYTIIMTLLLTNGATEKSFTTILGCTFGVAVAALLSVLFDKIMHLTGMLDEHTVYLQYLGGEKGINLRALVFSMIVIGAMGAVMDVAMDISSSLYEIHRHASQISFKELFLSGIRIGRDVMGTMANTLVLAYIGSSLCSVLLLITYSSSLLELLNRENIVVEIMQSLVGSTAILLTIPLTSIVCGILYTDSDGRRFAEKNYLDKNADIDSMEVKDNTLSANTGNEKGIFYYSGKK